MINLKSSHRFLISAWLVLLSGTCGAVTLQGHVTDNAENALRAVLVKATDKNQSVSRFTNEKGEYRIDDLSGLNLKVSTYLVGYEDQVLSVETNDIITANFKLEPQWNKSQLSSAEVLTSLPENQEINWLKARCIGCHGLTQLERFRGVPEQGWNGILAAMVMNYGRDDLNAAEKQYAAKLAVKYFGPGTHAPERENVTLNRIDDAALEATYYEVDLPTVRSFPHSIVADNKGNAWVAEFGNAANKITKWNFSENRLLELPLNLPESGPHTPTIDHEGKVWTALLNAGQLTVLDPKTNAIEYIPLDMHFPHTLSTDSQGNVWGNGTKIYRVDPQTRKITYWNPIAFTELPIGSWKDMGRLPGSPEPKNERLFAYHAVADSKGMLWYTSLETGWLVRLDPATGKQKAFKSPGVNASRGLVVDTDDNIWYTNWGGHGIARLDQRTGNIKLFKLPTKYAMPYSIFEDKKRGYLWMSDYNGNNLTRFDPKTESFVEYPLPSRESYPRFISVDEQGRVWFAEWWQDRVGLLDPYSGERTD